MANQLEDNLKALIIFVHFAIRQIYGIIFELNRTRAEGQDMIAHRDPTRRRRRSWAEFRRGFIGFYWPPSRRRPTVGPAPTETRSATEAVDELTRLIQSLNDEVDALADYTRAMGDWIYERRHLDEAGMRAELVAAGVTEEESVQFWLAMSRRIRSGADS
jgi:hypothetical protein